MRCSSGCSTSQRTSRGTWPRRRGWRSSAACSSAKPTPPLSTCSTRSPRSSTPRRRSAAGTSTQDGRHFYPRHFYPRLYTCQVNRALGKLDPALGPPFAGGSPFVTSLIGRLGHPNALVRRLLLNVLTSIYQRHSAPKQLVKIHQLVHARAAALMCRLGEARLSTAWRAGPQEGGRSCRAGAAAARDPGDRPGRARAQGRLGALPRLRRARPALIISLTCCG